MRSKPHGRAAAGHEQFRRRGGDLQLGRVAPAVVQFLTGRRGEADGQLQQSGGHRALGPVGLDSALVHLLRFLGDRHIDQLVLVRLDHHQERLRAGHLGVVHNHVGGLGQAARQRGDRVRGRIVAADGTVVGVGDRHRAVREHRHAQRVLQPGLGGLPVAEAEVEQALADGGLNGDRAAVVDHEFAQGGGFGIRHPDVAVGVLGETGGLGEPGFRRRAVEQAFQAVAGDDGYSAGARVEAEDLVHAGHGHHDRV